MLNSLYFWIMRPIGEFLGNIALLLLLAAIGFVVYGVYWLVQKLRR